MLIIFASELRARVPHLRGQQAEAVLPGEVVKHCKKNLMNLPSGEAFPPLQWSACNATSGAELSWFLSEHNRVRGIKAGCALQVRL